MRSSMALRFWLRRSNSSLRPVTGMRSSEIALHDRACRVGSRVHPAQHAPAHDNGARNSDDEDKSPSEGERPSQEPLQGLLTFDVTSDEEMQIAGEPGDDAVSRVLDLLVSTIPVGEFSRALRLPKIGGDAVKVSGKPSARAVGEKIKSVVRGGRMLGDRVGEGGQPPFTITRQKKIVIALHGSLRLVAEKSEHGDIDVNEDGGDSGAE